MAAVCSHGQDTRTSDGRMFTTVRDLLVYFNIDSWYEQNFNTVKYYLEIMALAPDLAPRDVIRILAADRAIVSIDRPLDGTLLEYTTAGGKGTEQVLMPDGPRGYIFAGGVALPELTAPPTVRAGWYHDPATDVVTIRHDTSPVTITALPVAVPEGTTLAALRLRAITPPGSTEAMFAVDLATPGPLTVAVYDLKGRRVRTLVEDSWWPGGPGTLSWDGRDQAGRQVASGIYLVQGRSAGATASTRIVRVR
jgi:hypothetical protein